ncbi:MAG: GIY-YIG nuclease family protein [Pseudomonadota bacterium]
MSNHYVYILSSKPHGVLYIGNTNDLVRRVWQHKSKEIEGFTKKYHVSKLVYYEHFKDKWDAALRERRLKKWNRDWKVELIEKNNPDWHDLYETLI